MYAKLPARLYSHPDSHKIAAKKETVTKFFDNFAPILGENQFPLPLLSFIMRREGDIAGFI